MSLVNGMVESLNNTKSETEIGIGGYRLFARVRETVNYRNIVPTDTLEDGSSSTDDIINEPITVSIEGVVSNLFVEERQYPQLVSRDFSAVGEITALLPAKSQQQIQRISQIDSQIRDAVLAAERAERLAGKPYEFFGNSGNSAKTEQEKFIDFMEALYFSRRPTEVSVNFRDYKNMALVSFIPVRDNNTKDTRFTADFQQINYSTLVYTPVSSPSKSVSGKVSDASNKGGQNPESNETGERSLLSSLVGG
ncbi:hypothetical protein [Vibrio phage XM1]|uniref:Uncharacterized protein n=1 Tax=Vibrio phage XM1 TaxID=2748688 RepID=UPI0015F2295E|nr:Chain A3, baseplate organization protein, gp11 [Vibrio phage XM1]7KH1_B3 Chain B3, baseplate organization protein, gp11 [Vibrio phage XM1]7KH1_C3 Chain C3, baseplate organization protein, gp11 [Vibrio phage XM1]7KH1_D3 Chain D3, baseplate organization protein, gp11 [Vibrio phage XM1]7KH1_E3 Chain E3, baseplate organization protein, gp11 [Vibrio phage XM1]7KH1_F3 Chain F3, baseplate organization protein, gp11 [Vibrio phage XM1]QMP81681.1 hypothetical protein [Vibrio phage XM1]